ncbi:MAG: ATP-binding protein [Elusimicrobiota bacterium]|jgi:signal transduction histidine kinase
MTAPDDAGLTEHIFVDNRFRLCLCCAVFAVAAILRALHLLSGFTAILTLTLLYSLPHLLFWIRRPPPSMLRPTYYALGALDFAAITIAVHLTGGPTSPFFYLYPIPFIIHALHFDAAMIIFDGILGLGCYGGLLWRYAWQGPAHLEWMGIWQLFFLGLIVITSFVTARQFQRKNLAIHRGVNALRTTVVFLDALNALPPSLSSEDLQQRILEQLNEVLRPLRVYPRLWILNPAWKTLQGFGEHPALRPGSLHHLPILACPVFALRQPFRYRQAEGNPWFSEQFNYAKHLCLPILNDPDCYGVAFLGSYDTAPWNAEDLHLFDMLMQSIALTIHRRALFVKLQEKIAELNFSFEVGTTSLATFMGSTQSIDETTLRILDGVIAILKVDRATLMLWDPNKKALQSQWVRGGDFQVRSPISLHMGEGMAGWALQTRQPYWAEYAMGDPHYRASAQPICSLLCVPVFTIDGQPLGVINAVTTQSPRIFLEREINFLTAFGRQAALAIENAQLHHKSRANIDQLSDLNQMKSQFLSLVSHDLRGPLTGVRGFCEVLRAETTGPLTPRQIELIEHMERQVELQERMVDDLLDLARMEKGQLSIHPAPTDLATLLKEEVEKSQPEARERRIALNLVVQGREALLAVSVDGDRIRQVIWNLIHNALKFTPEEGRVVVRALGGPESVTIDVEDTGVGLSHETQDVVFDKFFQVSPGGSKGAQGLGLGLAICKEIVLSHRGKIWAQSPGLGLGTAISFTLPVAASDAAQPSKAA